jgi:hypothetical protein
MSSVRTSELLAIDRLSRHGAVAMPPNNSFEGTRRKRLAPQAGR